MFLLHPLSATEMARNFCACLNGSQTAAQFWQARLPRCVERKWRHSLYVKMKLAGILWRVTAMTLKIKEQNASADGEVVGRLTAFRHRTTPRSLKEVLLITK